MPRKAGLDAPGTPHHVIIRGIEKGKILRDTRDREESLRRLGEATKTGTVADARVLSVLGGLAGRNGRRGRKIRRIVNAGIGESRRRVLSARRLFAAHPARSASPAHLRPV